MYRKPPQATERPPSCELVWVTGVTVLCRGYSSGYAAADKGQGNADMINLPAFTAEPQAFAQTRVVQIFTTVSE